MTTYCHCYVPAGSIGITQDGSNLDPECWSSPELRTWKWFTHGDKCSLDLAEVHQLPSKVQQSLLKGPSIRSYARLLRCLWIKLEFMVNEEIGVLRVYLLPDDILRRRIDRSDMSLQRSRQTLIQSLDYSANVWLGNHNAFLPSSPTPYQQIDQIDDMSLLQMFNNIPSPSPNPSDIRDPDAQNGMYSLLESKVEGLKMYMYPYQRRSAALMLQKELQPGMVLDPRLLHVRDQLGNGWYMDAVAGTVLLEPRHYHGTSGGILAEEMGAGKTIICLALILASKGITSSAPELYGIGDPPIRQRLGSLADMAASTANRNAVALKPYFDAYASEMGYNFPNCPKVLERNPGYYFVPANQSPRRGSRSGMGLHLSPQKIYLSAISLVVVPNNLVIQWRLEIRKHTDGLKTLVLVKNDAVPEAEHILTYDIVLFSQSRFEKEAKISASTARSTLFSVHFKRCIVDEGHKLGNSRISSRSILLSGLDKLHCSSRWIVTGTPSHGLFGVDSKDTAGSPQVAELPTSLSTNEMEKKDLERLGAMAALYLKARPWANTCMEDGDTLAEWSTYLMLPKHKFKSQGRWDCLRSTLNSLIIRHRKKDIGDLLPPVKEKIVVLDGSYQDRLSMNIFSMMIIFNSIQSQRNDMDYFFHPKQKSSLLQIVHNLKQSSFFGGSFFTSAEIAKAVETAEEFLREKKVSISDGDEALLQSALQIGFLATNNSLRDLSNQYHEMPVCVEGFPVDAREAWSLGASSGEIVCTSASLLLSLQTLIYKTTGEPDKFNALLNGGLILEGAEAKNRLLQNQNHRDSFKKPQTLAGNTRLGDGSVQKARIHGVNNVKPMIKLSADTFSKSLEPVKITATISAKMSYLLDNIVKYQIEEKIIIFYENENIAWYLASMLDVVSDLRSPGEQVV